MQRHHYQITDNILHRNVHEHTLKSFIGEESVAAGAPSVLSDGPTWIIDPIDGTTNFVHR